MDPEGLGVAIILLPDSLPRSADGAPSVGRCIANTPAVGPAGGHAAGMKLMVQWYCATAIVAAVSVNVMDFFPAV